jgi:hypothetical protein
MRLKLTAPGKRQMGFRADPYKDGEENGNMKVKRVRARSPWTKKQLDDARWALNYLTAHSMTAMNGTTHRIEQGLTVLEKMHRLAEREYGKKVTVYLKTLTAKKPRITAEEKRVALLTRKWICVVPAKGANKGQELWQAPWWPRRGYPRFVTLSSAYRAMMKAEGV